MCLVYYEKAALILHCILFYFKLEVFQILLPPHKI